VSEHWVRFALSSETTATINFTEPPTADDLTSLLEILDVQIRILKRAEAARPAASATDAGEVE
jgi:hypothetical protein